MIAGTRATHAKVGQVHPDYQAACEEHDGQNMHSKPSDKIENKAGDYWQCKAH